MLRRRKRNALAKVAMSGPGTFRTSKTRRRMSAYGAEADIENVRLVYRPQGDWLTAPLRVPPEPPELKSSD
jgi:hypothetical protein